MEPPSSWVGQASSEQGFLRSDEPHGFVVVELKAWAPALEQSRIPSRFGAVGVADLAYEVALGNLCVEEVVGFQWVVSDSE